MEPEALVGIDQHGFIAEWSIAAAALLGWTHAEVIGRLMAETIIPEHYRERHLKGLAHYLATGEGPFLGDWVDIEALHRDGHEVPVRFAPWAVVVGGEQRFYAALQRLERRAKPRPDATE